MCFICITVFTAARVIRETPRRYKTRQRIVSSQVFIDTYIGIFEFIFSYIVLLYIHDVVQPAMAFPFNRLRQSGGIPIAYLKYTRNVHTI